MKQKVLVILSLIMIGGLASTVLAADWRDAWSEEQVIRFFNNVADALLMIIGVISIFAILYAGFLFMVSGGDQKVLDEAKNFVRYAIIGIIVAALAFSVVGIINSLI